MIRVTRSRVVGASPEVVWDVVSGVERLPEWLVFAESAETVEGAGLGRLHRIHGHWGSRRSEVDQRIVAWEPGRLLAWEHQAERLDGRPAPRFARTTRFELRLQAAPGGTLVTMASEQRPDSVLKGLVMRAGRRELERSYDRSLERLEAAVSRARV